MLSISPLANLQDDVQLEVQTLCTTAVLHTKKALSPLLGEFILLGQQLELDFSFVIVQQDAFIRLSLRRTFILCVVRESVLYWPAASQVELIALHIAACAGSSDTEYANAVVHDVATDCVNDTLSFIMQSNCPAQAIALVGRGLSLAAPRSTCKLANRSYMHTSASWEPQNRQSVARNR